MKKKKKTFTREVYNIELKIERENY